MNAKSSRAPGSPQREAILMAATATFLRYGFKKTSMDDVAQTAGISRQGLYLYFATKDVLFREALQYLVSHMISTARSVADDGNLSLKDRLLGVFEAVHGSAFQSVARTCLRTAAVGAVCRRHPPGPIGPGPDGDCRRSTRGGGGCESLEGGRRHGRRTVR